MIRHGVFLGQTHMAIQDPQDGMAVDWREQVSDEQYRR